MTKLPFLWGAATSSHQIEGYNEHNDWWAWEHEGRVEGGVRSAAATDHLNRFREDIRLASELGLNSYRFSIEWSRIEPREGDWSESALDWYADLISECERYGIVPMATLHHFTSPKWFAAGGGFSAEGSPEKFARFVRQVIERLGRRIPLWCTINEPMVLAVGGYIGGFMPPAEHAPAKVALVSRNLLRSHVRAYELLHSEISGVQVGIAHNMLDFRPDRKWHPMERVLTSVFWRFYNMSWLDAVMGKKQRFGVPFLLPSAPQAGEALGRRTVDFIGVNYYTKAYIRWRPEHVSQEMPKDLPFGISFARRSDVVSDLGWAISAKGFRKLLKRVAVFGLPIYITENGIADREDKLRSGFLMSHLGVIAKAIAEGMDIRGYYHWSLLDNFEWIKGFWPRFGLYQIDYETFERKATASALLYKKIIAAHAEREGFKPDVACFFGE